MPERFSHRTDWPARLNRLQETALRLRADETSDFVDLTESNPTRCGFAFSKRDWLEAFRTEANLSYDPQPLGLLRAREAVAAYYAARGAAVSPEQIVLTSGTSEAYNFLLRLLTHPGESVMTPAPSYPLIDLLLDLNDLRQNRYPLTYADDTGRWAFDAANARQARQAQTRALVIVQPNNPTGHVFNPEERDGAVEFARKESMALIVDEVFLDYGDDPRATFAAENRTLTFTLSGISKVLGLPQMKLSWIVVSGPEAERREAVRRLEIIADTFLSVATPAQNALGAWLAAAPEVHAEIRARVDENRRTLAKLYAEQAKGRPATSAFGGAKLLNGTGAWSAVLRLAGLDDDETAAYELLERQHVLTHPGYLFDFIGGPHAAVSLLPPPAVFAEGARRLFLI